MSLFVHQLNDDSSFSLTFAPSFAIERHVRKFPGCFSILVDPWFEGSSSILHPVFQISRHARRDLTVKSLRDVELPDLILISQDKPDHCHRRTLCSLPDDTNVKILATPAAARKIRSWGYFKRPNIRLLKPFDRNVPSTVVRIPLPPFSTGSAPGEIAIANIVQKKDLTNVHNAVAVVYRPPGTVMTMKTGRSVDLHDMAMMTPPFTPKSRSLTSSATSHGQPSSPGGSNLEPSTLRWRADDFSLSPPETPDLPELPAELPIRHIRGHSLSSQASSARRAREKPLSVIYSPHGVDYATLEPFVEQHLVPDAVLPLDVLFHGFTMERNPWFLGGTVANGAPGGMLIARKLDARHWVSAHDEVKDNRGMATVMIKSKPFGVEDVQEMLKEGAGGNENQTEVHVLGCTGRIKVAAATATG